MSKVKERILKAPKNLVLGNPIKVLSDFSAETLQDRKEGHGIFTVLEKNIFPTKNTLPSKVIIQNWKRE